MGYFINLSNSYHNGTYSFAAAWVGVSAAPQDQQRCGTETKAGSPICTGASGRQPGHQSLTEGPGRWPCAPLSHTQDTLASATMPSSSLPASTGALPGPGCGRQGRAKSGSRRRQDAPSAALGAGRAGRSRSPGLPRPSPPGNGGGAGAGCGGAAPALVSLRPGRDGHSPASRRRNLARTPQAGPRHHTQGSGPPPSSRPPGAYLLGSLEVFHFSSSSSPPPP